MNLLITGANGFVGASLSKMLVNRNHDVTALRRDFNPADLPYDYYSCLIHLAGRAHVMQETTDDIYSAYKAVNVDYTLKVVELARSLRIKRFIFLSSIKVNGEVTNVPFNESDTPAPLDAYGQTKLEAELLLKNFCTEHEIELVIIRAPLIYGPGVKANFKSLIQLCKKTVPIPFGSVRNKRSLVSLDNLNNFIELCCIHPVAANQTFLISDDQDISTKQLVNTIRAALGRNSWQLPIPASLLSIFFNLVGKHYLNERLLSNLQLDISKAKRLLNWRPVITFEDGIKQTVANYVD